MFIYRSLTLVLLFNWIGLQATAQEGPAGRGRGTMPAIGKVFGKVLDADTKKPVEFATVTVFQAGKDSVLGGSMVMGNGDFSVEKLPLGALRLKVGFMGYKTLEQAVQLTREAAELDLGNLILETNPELLQAAEVVAEKATMTMQVDRRVFNVEKDLTTQGGTGIEVMKNVPGLTVDVDGNVQMRGSNPQILIDGRPSSITLEQIPAEEIERVEVITNPSVAFDANTTGGIINVVLKKSTKPGYSGQLQGGVGSNDRYQAGGNINAKDGRWAFNLSYNYNTGRNLTNGDTRRTDLNNGETLGFFDQTTTSNSSRGGHGGRFGVDWQATNRSLFTLSQGLRFMDRGGSDKQAFTSRNSSGTVTERGEQINTTDNSMQSYSTQFLYTHTSPKPGKEWTMDVNYNRWQRDTESDFDRYTYGQDGTPLVESPRLQKNLGGSTSDSYTFQTDWKEPIGERTKLEWGAKVKYSLDNTFLNVFETSPNVDEAIKDTSLTNDYLITDNTNAIYLNWMRKLNDRWSAQAGLRFEQTSFTVDLRGKDVEYRYAYPDGSSNLGKALFPAIYLVRNWEGSDREVQFNFSRKIDRPRFWQIMPVIWSADSRNIRIGNPALAPQFSNLGEVNHLIPFMGGKATWLTSAFGRFTENVITSYSSPLPSDSTILRNTYVNGANSTRAGWENIFKFRFWQDLQVTLSGTLQYTALTLSSDQGGLRNEGTNWEAKALVQYKFKKAWNIQLNGEYESPEVQAQGRSLSQYSMDASLGYDFNKRLTGVVSVNDLFYTNRNGSTINTPYLIQENFSRREQRYVRFTLTWKFGESDASLFRKKGQRPESGNGGGEMDF